MANWKKGISEIRVDAARSPRKTVSACLIVRNEEEKLGRCLTSLMGAVDEIVVVDTGSTDRTVEIAQKYGARLGHFTWIDDFSAARNAALEMATGDWVLSIDADEWLASDLVRLFVRSAAQRTDHVAFVPNVRLPNGQEYWASTRLFPRTGSRWEYRVHEQIRLARKETRGVFDKEFVFLHDGYGEDRLDKAERNFALLRRQLAETPAGSDPHKHAQVYLARARKDPLSAEDVAQMEEGLKVAIGFDVTSLQLITYRLYRHWLESGQFDEIDRLNEIAWSMGARGPLNYYARAVRFYEEGKKGKALTALDESERVDDLIYARVALRSLFIDLRRMISEMA